MAIPAAREPGPLVMWRRQGAEKAGQHLSAGDLGAILEHQQQVVAEGLLPGRGPLPPCFRSDRSCWWHRYRGATTHPRRPHRGPRMGTRGPDTGQAGGVDPGRRPAATSWSSTRRRASYTTAVQPCAYSRIAMVVGWPLEGSYRLPALRAALIATNRDSVKVAWPQSTSW